jgi:hypothetical protein
MGDRSRSIAGGRMTVGSRSSADRCRRANDRASPRALRGCGTEDSRGYSVGRAMAPSSKHESLHDAPCAVHCGGACSEPLQPDADDLV